MVINTSIIAYTTTLSVQHTHMTRADALDKSDIKIHNVTHDRSSLSDGLVMSFLISTLSFHFETFHWVI